MTSGEYRKQQWQKMLAETRAIVKKQFEHYYKIMGKKQ